MDVLEHFDDGALTLIPDFTGDECSQCTAPFCPEIFWETNKKIVTRNAIKFINGM